MHVGSLHDDLTLKCMDEDVTKDDFVWFKYFYICVTFRLEWVWSRCLHYALTMELENGLQLTTNKSKQV